MNKILLTACIGVAGFISASAMASYANPGKIDNIITTPYGNVFFTAGPQVSPPACSANNAWAFQVTGPNAEGGRAMLASLIAAQAANKNVFVSGRGDCQVAGDRETVDYIVVYSN